MQLHDITETEWCLIRDLIPMAASTEESRLRALRSSVNGILWRMRTGEPWTQVPSEYGYHRFVYACFVEWRQSGVWENVTKMLAQVRGAANRTQALNLSKPRSDLHPEPN
jgi:transposase